MIFIIIVLLFFKIVYLVFIVKKNYQLLIGSFFGLWWSLYLFKNDVANNRVSILISNLWNINPTFKFISIYCNWFWIKFRFGKHKFSNSIIQIKWMNITVIWCDIDHAICRIRVYNDIIVNNFVYWKICLKWRTCLFTT